MNEALRQWLAVVDQDELGTLLLLVGGNEGDRCDRELGDVGIANRCNALLAIDPAPGTYEAWVPRNPSR